ncbi:hypothetical protein [Nocardioides sp. cx-173]|uniref:hypothetical protein n=1 Tax=Nocardioides sp. cx-173 TaxID=2898796 RepID=UPI001E3F121C|nr:hypothetical protein [Nocardioides sp. cx-173]MCD4527280.1 hypothetical protein [Nocardioides sp. cx-173]UGB40343.1 hypothetical protein LQ940_13215 [Nocardioides sp. cx-173]
MTELHDLLDRATDGIESPRLEQVALQTARRRRTASRGAAAAVVASALVVAVVVGTQVGGDRTGGLPPAGPSETPAAPPTSAPPEATVKVWPRWDPRKVDGLPAAPARFAPALPDVIDPPDTSPLLSDDPVEAAVLAVEQSGVAQVLGTDGEWRTVPLDGRYPIVSLSPDGTRLAVFYDYDTRDLPHDYGVALHHLATGETSQLDPPAGFEPWDSAGWSFLDEETLLFTSGPQAYEVVIGSGETEQMTVPAGISKTSDPEGGWLVSADWTEPNVLTDYAGGTPREVSMVRTGRLLGIQADADTVVGTSYDRRPFQVVVADRRTLTPRYRLPVLDFEGNYSNWGLGTVAIADDGTVLLRVAAIARRVDGFRLVAWEPTTGELSVVSATHLPVESSVVFAPGFLREIGPG